MDIRIFKGNVAVLLHSFFVCVVTVFVCCRDKNVRQRYRTMTPDGVGSMVLCQRYRTMTPDGVGSMVLCQRYRTMTPDGVGSMVLCQRYRTMTPNGIGWCNKRFRTCYCFCFAATEAVFFWAFFALWRSRACLKVMSSQILRMSSPKVSNSSV